MWIHSRPVTKPFRLAYEGTDFRNIIFINTRSNLPSGAIKYFTSARKLVHVVTQPHSQRTVLMEKGKLAIAHSIPKCSAIVNSIYPRIICDGRPVLLTVGETHFVDNVLLAI